MDALVACIWKVTSFHAVCLNAPLSLCFPSFPLGKLRSGWKMSSLCSLWLYLLIWLGMDTYMLISTGNHLHIKQILNISLPPRSVSPSPLKKIHLHLLRLFLLKICTKYTYNVNNMVISRIITTFKSRFSKVLCSLIWH